MEWMPSRDWASEIVSIVKNECELIRRVPSANEWHWLAKHMREQAWLGTPTGTVLLMMDKRIWSLFIRLQHATAELESAQQACRNRVEAH